ncbi:Aspartic peptidase, DDI1-type domain-containing protein [Rozella allomycis CSF55]|uniref:DNA damage-inducible protein 1 n=1 Tax=Rozella allomycis (strain CSF55) TaxID=988480 RepID=A0A075ATT9_ROZAC|nr:Aspartic peptidase, DDI1-type domain-containing protein [Rozella allomycis CSF55]|eukprot:EPZ31967.1 Aspartic peptidase, DDI1-type domain-containing protein [Rozella allomycis CSF55]
MQITFVLDNGQLNTIDVDKSLNISSLKALLESEMKIPRREIVLIYNGKEISNNDLTLEHAGISNFDVITIRRKQSQIPSAPNVTGSNQNTLQNMLQNPELMRQFQQMISNQQMPGLGTNDSMSLDYQKRLEENIRMQNVQQNMELAMEYYPEMFGSITMLYVNCQVNGINIKAFVDSGAQMTILNKQTAERLGLMELLDTRYQGKAVGVGTANIIGRIHAATLKIGNQHLMCSFTVMEGQGVEFLFGLDMLKRHQAKIDLEKNCLNINGEEIHFLPESEIPLSGLAKSPLPSPQVKDHPTSSSSKSTSFDEDTIQNLINLTGAGRDNVIEALKLAQGNPDLAVSYLMELHNK